MVIEAAEQTDGARFRSVFVQVTEDVMNRPGARDKLIQKAKQLQDDMVNRYGYPDTLKAIIVDPKGRQIYPTL